MALAPASPIAPLLQGALKRKKLHHPAYSLGALARDLGVSTAFASNVLSGKRLPPKDRLERLSHCLELDVPERALLVRALVLDGFSAKLLGGVKRKPAGLKKRVTMPASARAVLASWANFAVLEGLTLDPPFCEPNHLADRLGLTSAAFEKALATLLEAGLVEKEQGRWRKTNEQLYVAGGRTRQEVRNFHAQMIQKAKDELLKTEPEDYRRRLINGFTLAVNPAHLERLKARAVEFLDELAQAAGEGECREVYQCNFQLFPLTRRLP